MKGINLPHLAVIIIVIITLITLSGTISFVVSNRVVASGQANTPNDIRPNDDSLAIGQVDLGEFMTDLADTTTRRYVKVNIVLGFGETKKFLGLMRDTSLEKELIQRDSEIKDLIFTVLRSKTAEQLRGHNIDAFKQEMLNGINKLLASGQISHIFFSNIVIQ